MATDTQLDQEWRRWRDRRPVPRGIHLDTAAAGRCSMATLAAMAAHAELEATAGAYVAQAEAEPVLERGRADLAGLLGVPAAGVAFTESASAARAVLLSAWPLRAGDTVAILPSEWGPNMSAFADRGLELTELPAEADGTLSFSGLRDLLAARPPAVVHLTQVASHRGLVQPVAAAAELCRAAGVPLWVDAAQSIGHADTACGADAVYATSRKWLAGPRGVGLLAIADRWWDRLRTTSNPLARASMPTGSSPVRLLESAEATIAGRAGLSAAVREHLEDGPARVRERLAAVGLLTRQVLAGLPGWAVDGFAEAPSAITALRPTAGQDLHAVQAGLLAGHGILTTTASPLRAPRQMTGPVLRISPHVDCTIGDLTALREALAAAR
jgi:hercynylcysteine S-oxide lyase